MPDPHDWEADVRSYPDCLRAWRAAHGWTWEQTAHELRDRLPTLQGHLKGRACGDEATKRRLMTLIDRLGR